MMSDEHGYFRSSWTGRIVLIVFVVLGMTVILNFIGKKTGKARTEKQTPSALLGNNKSFEKLQRDTDGDGLKDWEEALYRTDQQKADTDGDGAPDGEEIKMSRDPLKPGPNDALATSTIEYHAGQDQQENLTRKLAGVFGQKMIARRLIDPSAPFDPDQSGQEIVDGFLQTVPDEIPSTLTAKDIVIGKDNSDKTVQTYATALERITHDHWKQFGDIEDVAIFAQAMEQEHYQQLEQLDPYLAVYDQVITELKKLPVPPRLVILHLQYLNLASAQADTIRKMRFAEQDPINALVGAQQYITLQERFNAVVQNFRVQYQKSGVK